MTLKPHPYAPQKGPAAPSGAWSGHPSKGHPVASIQFGPSGEVLSTESANALELGQRTTNPFNFNAGSGIVSPELLAASRGNEQVAARAASVHINSGGKASMQFGEGGGMQSHGVTRVNSWDTANGESGLLATARRDGTPRPAHELKPTDLIDIDGIPTTVEVAERLGFVTRDPRTGIRENVSPEAHKEATGEAAAERAAEAAVKAEAERAQRAEAAKLANPEAEAAAQEIAGKVQEGEQVAAVIQMIESGVVTPSTIARAASQAECTPDEMRARVDTAMGGYTAQAQAYAAERGVPFEVFQGWARLNHMSEVKQAAVQHATQRNVAAWGPLMQKFMHNLDRIAPDLITGAKFPNGGSAYMDPGSRTAVIRMPNGHTMSWSAALRAGLLGDLKWGR